MMQHGACLILLAALVFVQAITPNVLSDLRTTSSLTRNGLEAGGEYRGGILLEYRRMHARVSQVMEDVEHDHAPSKQGKAASSDSKLGAQMGQPRDASWFRAFSDGESTFDVDGVERREPGAHTYFDRDGLDSGMEQLATPTALPAVWFDESKSGGSEQAWQTFYPAVGNYHPRGSHNPAWRSGHQVYEQQYQPSTGTALRDMMLSHKGKPAEWFDGSIRQYDAFGRLREPTSASGRRYLEWTTRSRNTTLTCGPPGCVANASLKVFDSATESHRSCRLSIKVHATDFDDEFSREHIEWFKVNDELVNSKCDPMAKFCNDSVPLADRAWYPCLSDMRLDSLIDTGSLNVSGKLSPMVDECPADGNLLSGIVIVTCFVRPRPDTTTPPPAIAGVTTPAPLMNNGVVSAVLQCAEPGCVANATVLIDQAAIANQDCKLTIVVNQTDFDGDEGSKEVIEWVKVANVSAKEDIKPGRNPCKEAANGKNVSNITYVALDNYDVTQAAGQLGYVFVQAKISDMVDECGSEGYLFDGRATVTCTERGAAAGAGTGAAGDAVGAAAAATPAPTSAT